MFTALHLTVKHYGNEWKRQRCNMNISEAPLLIWTISPPPVPAACQQTRQHTASAPRRCASFPGSVDQLHYRTLLHLYKTIQSSTRFPPYLFVSSFFFPFSSSGGQEICGWWCSSWSKAWQIKRLSTSQGILWLRKESCCPLPESDSLITVERMNLKRGGRGVLCLPAMSYNWCLYIDIHMMDI